MLPVFYEFKGAELWVAGTGSYEGRLRHLAAGSDSIRFLGLQSHRQLEELYANAVAVIVPSLWQEVFGTIVIEAFAMRTPVIVSDQGALPELVRESGGGLIYRTRQELEAAVHTLLADHDQRRQLGEQGHNAYQRLWTAEHHLKSYTALIDSLR